jgi:putative DNA primase/helicase
LGSTQPGRIADYIRQAVRGGSGDDGLIQRFGLLVWPDNGNEWRDVDRWPDNSAKREAIRVFEMLDQLEPQTVGALQDTDYNGEPDGLPYLRFDENGLVLFLEWRTDLEAKLRGGELHPAMESHLAKYRKLVPGLALILHLASGGTGPVSEQATLQALAWSEYLETHARRAYASVTTAELSIAKAIIQRLRKGDLPRTFSSKDVWRKGWGMLSDREQVADALQLLVDLDWLNVTRQETAGRTATVYEVNPKVLAA